VTQRRIYWQGPEREPDPAVIEARNRFRDDIGTMFQHAQGEAYESYCAWENELLARTAAEVSRAVKHTRLKQKYLVPMILSLLKNEEMYDFQVSEAIKRWIGGQYALDYGGLLPILYRLKKSGLITGNWRTTPEGQEREYFRLTSSGLKVLEGKQKVLAKFFRLINVPNW